MSKLDFVPPWANQLDNACLCLDIQMEAAKKTYHMACKEEKLAATREANGKTEASVTPDQQKKLHEKVDKCKQDVQKVRKRADNA